MLDKVLTENFGSVMIFKALATCSKRMVDAIWPIPSTCNYASDILKHLKVCNQNVHQKCAKNQPEMMGI